MKKNRIFFSILIAYRNRDIVCVENCLYSIAQQTEKSFEVIFINYGSEVPYTTALELLMQKFPFCHYIYIESRGLFWNKSYCLNVGLSKAKGEVVVIVDVDLVFPSGFLEQVKKLFSFETLLHYTFFRLNKGIKWSKEKTRDDLKKNATGAGEQALGTIIAAKEALIKAGGYDTFYRVWGVEDIDMVMRLEAEGLRLETLDADENVVFHQWHPSVSQQLPKGWENSIGKYYQAKKKQIEGGEGTQNTFFPERILNQKDRPALQTALQCEKNKAGAIAQFTFDFPKEKSFVDFIKTFESLPSEGGCIVQQDFSFAPKTAPSKLHKVVGYTNRLLSFLKISYRLVDIHTYDTEYISLEEVHTFLFYFIISFELQILDYFLEIKANKLTWVVFKK